MTDDELMRFRRAVADYTAKATASPEAARAALVREGIFLEDGSLSPDYGGGQEGTRSGDRTAKPSRHTCCYSLTRKDTAMEIDAWSGPDRVPPPRKTTRPSRITALLSHFSQHHTAYMWAGIAALFVSPLIHVLTGPSTEEWFSDKTRMIRWEEATLQWSDQPDGRRPLLAIPVSGQPDVLKAIRIDGRWSIVRSEEEPEEAKRLKDFVSGNLGSAFFERAFVRLIAGQAR
jgi:hypothetical protein